MEPAADHATSHPPRPGASRARAILLRMSIVALVGGVILVLMGRSGKTQTVSHVIREIHKIVLRKPDGGFIGPWWVSAAGLDPITGELKAMKVEFGAIHMASKTARVVVNPDTDSFKFEMWDVVLIRVPPSTTQPDEDGGDGRDDPLVNLDRYVLGPIPYRGNIVPDEGDGARRTMRPLRNDRQ